MSLRNALLCWLLADVEPPPAVVAGLAGGDDAGKNHFLLALCLAKSGQVDRFAAVVGASHEAGIASISRYCLFLGLSDSEPQRAFLLFDILKRRAPTDARLWIDLAVLQAAWGYDAASLRSMAMHAALTGRKIESFHLAFAEAEPRTPPGPIRFLAGDATRFMRM